MRWRAFSSIADGRRASRSPAPDSAVRAAAAARRASIRWRDRGGQIARPVSSSRPGAPGRGKPGCHPACRREQARHDPIGLIGPPRTRASGAGSVTENGNERVNSSCPSSTRSRIFRRQAQTREAHHVDHRCAALRLLCRALRGHGRHLLAAHDAAEGRGHQRRQRRRRRLLPGSPGALPLFHRYAALAGREPGRV